MIAAKGYALEPGASISKLNFLYGALIDRPVESVYRAGNELAVVGLSDLDKFDRTHPGAGLFFEARVDSLADLIGFVNRKDQKLTAHSFSARSSPRSRDRCRAAGSIAPSNSVRRSSSAVCGTVTTCWPS